MFDLNAHTIFSFPAAVYRRFHVWTVMSVKPAFADQSGRLDAGKIRRFWDIVAATPGMGDGEYNEQFPPYWNFTIHETGDVINPTPFLVFNTDSSLRDYLAYVKDEFDKHTKAQKRVMEAHTGAKKLDLCEFCKLPFCLGVCQPAMVHCFARDFLLLLQRLLYQIRLYQCNLLHGPAAYLALAGLFQLPLQTLCLLRILMTRLLLKKRRRSGRKKLCKPSIIILC